MNITELARKLKISPNDLRERLPGMGFDIGPKAIKVDDMVAQRIIQAWKTIEAEAKEREKYLKKEEEEKVEKEDLKEVKIPAVLTVRDFAHLLNLPINQVISELIKNGIMASLNERIDYETASIVAEDLGFKIIPLGEEEIIQAEKGKEERLMELMKEDKKTKLKSRPPVIVVMGHVDHGKTKLLDYIRKENVIDTEAGGITQHMGAYQIEKKGKLITFIDTPGHEAFTAMRSRGAKVADIAILIVAADDGVKPQTVEALKIIENSKLPMVVAINKVDKPEANIEKVKQELSQHNLIPEEWGGKTIMMPISAKEGTGVDELLDSLLLVAEMEKDNIRANPKKAAAGTIIESHVDPGEGSVATVLVQTGTLKRGDSVSFNGVYFGKIRAMKDFKGSIIDEAGPSTPAKIIGLKAAPKVGDVLEVVGDDIKAKKVKSYELRKSAEVAQAIVKKKEDEKKKKINIILRGDVLGSVEAIIESLEKIETKNLDINVITKGLGNITEADVMKAEATDAMLLGFNVVASTAAENLAREKEVEIKTFKIIYELIDEVKKKIETMVEIETIQVDLGKIEVLAVFKSEKNSMVVGGKVIEGKVESDSKVRVMRKDKFIAGGELVELQSGKQVVKDVEKGQECGIKFSGRPVIEVGDILDVYKEEEREKKY